MGRSTRLNERETNADVIDQLATVRTFAISRAG
jgi:hypothetical protein